MNTTVSERPPAPPSRRRRIRVQAPVVVKAPWRWAVGGAVLGAAFILITQAPARWLASGLARVTDKQVLLGNAQGSIWRGSADLTLTGGTGSHDRTSLPGRVSWQLRPSWQGLHAQLQANCCTQIPLAVQVTPQWGGLKLKLSALQAQLPAELLQGLGAPWNTMQFQGQLQLSSSGAQAAWTAGRLQMQGEMRLTASDMASRVSPLKPLGSYEILLRGGENLTVNLSTLGASPLRLQGSGQWVGSRLRFSGVAEATSGYEAQLSNLLTLIGRRSGSRAILSVG